MNKTGHQVTCSKSYLKMKVGLQGLGTTVCPSKMKGKAALKVRTISIVICLCCDRHVVSVIDNDSTRPGSICDHSLP